MHIHTDFKILLLLCAPRLPHSSRDNSKAVAAVLKYPVCAPNHVLSAMSCCPSEDPQKCCKEWLLEPCTSHPSLKKQSRCLEQDLDIPKRHDRVRHRYTDTNAESEYKHVLCACLNFTVCMHLYPAPTPYRLWAVFPFLCYLAAHSS